VRLQNFFFDLQNVLLGQKQHLTNRNDWQIAHFVTYVGAHPRPPLRRCNEDYT